MAEKYNLTPTAVEQIISYIKSGEIAIPEIQRPFVWKPKQVRDLIDSLYTGYPTGYLIISQSPDMKLKDGSRSEGKKIMIDGQQRVTAIMTSIAGMEVMGADFKKKRIKIAFNPSASEDEEQFKVQDNAILRDKRWIADIAVIFDNEFDSYSFVQDYCTENVGIEPKELNKKITQLLAIKNRQIGVINLDKELSIDEVTEIFIRINSQGARLSQSDFAMSKIAANTKYGGGMLRKAIDYFSHLAAEPSWYSDMIKDEEFMSSHFASALKWLKDDTEEIFDPDYGDILRVAFMSQFYRGKMKDLVSLLGGRDFETRDYKEEIAEESFAKLEKGTLSFMNEYSFSQFILSIKSAGFISSKLINSRLTLDFAYTLFLLLNANSGIDKTQIKRYVARWYVMATLTSRYITSPETYMDMDIRRIKEKGFLEYLKELEEANLSETFWTVGLVQNLETSVVNSPHFNVFLASQVRNSDNSLLMSGVKVSNLIDTMGDIHHIFPKSYLQKNGITDKTKYNQVANFTYLDTTTNIAVGEKAPCDYFTSVFEQCETKNRIFGDIIDKAELEYNLKLNCIPQNINTMDSACYDDFLVERRKLMAQKIREYYNSL